MAVVLPAPQGQYLGVVKDVFPGMMTVDHLIHTVVVVIEIWAGSSLYQVYIYVGIIMCVVFLICRSRFYRFGNQGRRLYL